MIHPTCIALILRAEHTFGIAGLRRELGCRNGLRILFRLGKVDGDIQCAIFAIVLPLFILCDAVTADVVGVLRWLVLIWEC